MKTFTKLNTVRTIRNSKTNEEVKIVKVKKDGTQRIFFSPEFNGKKINSIMFARLSNAEQLANQYLKRNLN